MPAARGCARRQNTPACWLRGSTLTLQTDHGGLVREREKNAWWVEHFRCIHEVCFFPDPNQGLRVRQSNAGLTVKMSCSSVTPFLKPAIKLEYNQISITFFREMTK